ncbi:ABC transporter substrate-binding protein, partial [Escherichia coli]
MGDSSRMTCLFITSLWRRAVLLACLLWAAPAWSADILLTAAEDGAGVQAFAQALAQQRPEDHVTFTPLNDLPAPSRLPASTRLILLDLPGLDWRLQD